MLMLLACTFLFEEEKGVYNIQPWMLEPAAFRGVVVDEKDKPVAGATVFSEYDEVRPKATTDAKGGFTVTVPPGRAGMHHVTAFADGGARMSTPLPLRDQFGKTLMLKLKPAKAVQIVVVDKNGKPVPKATVVARSRPVGVMMPQIVGDDGMMKLWIPAEDRLDTIAAYKDGVGLDYLHFERENDQRTSSAAYLKQPGSDRITLTLAGAKPLTVRVKDPAGKPVVGAKVRVPNLTIQGRGSEYLNLYGHDDFVRESNADGVVEFAALPVNATRAPYIDAFSTTHSRVIPRFEGFPSDSPVREIVMAPRVELAGVVLDVEGKPAANAVVRIDGVDFRMGWGRSALVQSDANGRFRCMAQPNELYHFVAGRGRFASPVRSIVVNDKPVGGIELTMFPATRIYGKAGSAGAWKPGVGGLFVLQQRVPEYRDLPVAQQTLPEARYSRFAHVSSSGDIDKDGNYEMWVGPGTYYYTVDPYAKKETVIVVNGQKEIKQDFEPRVLPEKLRLDGKVVLERDPTKAVAGAEVKGHMPDSLNFKSGRRHLMVSGQPVTDAEGKFFVTRDVGEGLLEARTGDGKLAGTATFTERQKSIIIRVGPSVTIKGRVVDSDGKPKAKYEVMWSRITDRFSSGGVFSGRETTNDKGEFEILGLIPNQEYHLMGVLKRDDGNQPQSYRRLVELKPALPGVLDAGDLKAP
jgi:hypothetical protein